MNAMKRTHWLTAGFLLALGSGHPVLADDTELFVTAGGSPDSLPNILFIIDTSGSMDSDVITKTPYDQATSYPGSCDASRVYWRADTGAPPDCATDQWFNLSMQRCAAATTAFNGSGFYSGTIAQWDDDPVQIRWNTLVTSAKDNFVECQADAGLHGDGVDGSALYAANGINGPWDALPGNAVTWSGVETGNTYTLYSGNYMNWFYDPTNVTVSRLDVVQQVANDLLDMSTSVNVGLMRFSNNHDGTPEETRAEGGMVVHAVEDVELARVPMQTKINGFVADGWTPLSETLYEAGQYYAGRAVDFGLNSAGNTSQPEPSVPASRRPADQTLYQSPIQYQCQKSFVILLTDGAPTQDTNANGRIEGLPNFGTLVGASCDGAGNGACLDDMAEYMFEADLSPLPGQQNVVTYTIGFTVDLPILASTAARGGGQYFLADDTASLTTVLNNIVQEILTQGTTFTSPAVSVNAFNRTQNLNDIFVTVFQPEETVHWPGNLKKYRIDGDEIVGADGNPVVDPATGVFADAARSFWPDPNPANIPDGANVPLGGAARQLPVPASRNLYSYLSVADLTSASNEVNTANGLVTLGTLGGIVAAGEPNRDQLIEFARGADAADFDGDTDTTEPRLSMGDPLHAKPVTMIYGPNLDDAVIFSATNEGYLHAVDPSNGQELWAFAPVETLTLQRDRYFNALAANKSYGLDGNITIYRKDVDNDGNIEPGDGDRVYLYFGQRRGGDNLYALDVTFETSPRFLWQHSSATLPFLGQTWSTPTIAKVDVNGLPQNVDNAVVIIGGGYDDRHDNGPYGVDSFGNGIYMLDAISGDLLWRAGNDAGADLQLAEMNNSIVSAIRVLDMNSNGEADRMYAADLGGRIWRFDIFDGQTPASLVTGGVLARLGLGGIGGPDPSNNRRFFNTPDIALVPTSNSGGFLNVAIGSGYRAHPLDENTEDNFFSVRDPNVFNQLTQAEYVALTPIVFGDLVDITDNLAPVLPVDAKGWRLELRAPKRPGDPAVFGGEKVLSESRTFLNTIFFTSFAPDDNGDPCAGNLGINKLYAIDILDGAPVNNLDNSVDPNNLTAEDRYLNLRQGGIAPEPVFLFPDQSACTGNCPDVLGLVGVETFDPGAFPPFVRTFWFTQDSE